MQTNPHEVDHQITAPHYDEPFLQWYETFFNAVYIALHPFCQIEGIDPADAPRLVQVVNRQDMSEPLSLEVERMRQDRLENFSLSSKEYKRLEKASGKRVTWENIRHECGFASIAQVNRALLTSTMALNEKSGNASDAQHLQAFCSKAMISLPDEDIFPAILEKPIAEFLKQVGCDEVIMDNEQNDYELRLTTSQLNVDLPWQDAGVQDFRASKIYSREKSLLMIVPWDDFYTAICGNRDVLEKSNVEQLFEGFWCTKETRPGWWNQ